MGGEGQPIAQNQPVYQSPPSPYQQGYQPGYQPGYQAPPSPYQQGYQQPYGSQPNVVILNHGNSSFGSNPDDTLIIIQIVLLVVGLFICCAWGGGLCFLKHPNQTVRILAIINSLLFILATCIFCGSLAFVFIFYAVLIGSLIAYEE